MGTKGGEEIVPGYPLWSNTQNIYIGIGCVAAEPCTAKDAQLHDLILRFFPLLLLALGLAETHCPFVRYRFELAHYSASFLTSSWSLKDVISPMQVSGQDLILIPTFGAYIKQTAPAHRVH